MQRTTKTKRMPCLVDKSGEILHIFVRPSRYYDSLSESHREKFNEENGVRLAHCIVTFPSVR